MNLHSRKTITLPKQLDLPWFTPIKLRPGMIDLRNLGRQEMMEQSIAEYNAKQKRWSAEIELVNN